MLKTTAENYAKYVSPDLQSKLVPINQSIDDMLTRLEEFEAMVAIVQQERCNAVGLTGALTQVSDAHEQLKELCQRINTVETLIEHVKDNVESLENRVEVAEQQLGITDSTNKIKSLILPLFVKPSETKLNENASAAEMFSTEMYFPKEGSN